MSTYLSLPEGLSVPVDDGACNHLVGLRLPDIGLNSTAGVVVNLSEVRGWLVVYCYPKTGIPNTPLPVGWDDIPGARGCTPQSCAFRDHYEALRALGVTALYGLSKQTQAYQQELVARLHLPYAVLSDADGLFSDALCLPMFTVEGESLLKRITLIAYDGEIKKVFYPVFPPDKNAEAVIAWFKEHV